MVPTFAMELDRLQWAIEETLRSWQQSAHPEDDLEELAAFLANEIDEAGILLPSLDNAVQKADLQEAYTLESLESMPITGVLAPHLIDLAGIPSDHVALCIDDILDLYKAGPPDELEEPSQATSMRSSSKSCELCERETILTEHHLIPRSEHDLFVKRGLVTQEECRTRIAMLCRPCHSAVHRSKSTRELATDFNTVEKLLEVPDIARFAEWNSKRKVLRVVIQRRSRR